MTEHVHEWELKAYLYVGVPVFGCAIKNCNAVLPVKQAEARLNATETLSAEDARYQATEHDCMDNKFRSDLLAYADILEGKDE